MPKGLDIINALNHEIRRDTLVLLEKSPMSYSQLLEKFNIASGKLNYHLKLMDGLVAKDGNGHYTLTALGRNALAIMKELMTQSADGGTPGTEVAKPADDEAVRLDAKAMKLLEYIKARLDEGQDGSTLYPYTIDTRKRIILLVSVAVGVAMLMLFIGIIEALNPESEPGADSPIAWTIISIMIPSVILVVLITVLKVRVLKQRAAARAARKKEFSS
ncbi:MAG: hypothetical protein JW839_13675 [Candidatus Lokiarchaeota archaeon]|nr:hypothetical protein [Candidatus Lokiarchaeota archaeon]